MYPSDPEVDPEAEAAERERWRARAAELEARTHRDADGRVTFIGASPEEVELKELSGQLRAVQSQIAQLQARSVALVARVDELRAFGVIDTLSTSAWLAWAGGLTTGEARRQVVLARRLPVLPRLAEAFATGEVSEGVAATLVKVATPANESRLLEAAEAATGPQLSRLVAEYKPLQPKAPVAGRDPSEEYLDGHFDEFGMYEAHIRTRAEDGAVFEAAIDATLDADREDTRAGGGDGGEPMTRVEALVAIATDHLAGTTNAPDVIPQRFQVIVRVDEAALHPDLDDLAKAEACVAGACSLDPCVARELACDAGIAALVERDGVPVQVTSPTRFATSAQVVALFARDRCCQYPGCGRTKRLIAHHVTPHPVGPTRVDELVLLCRKHHRKVHRRGWSTRWENRGPKRILVVVAPDGSIIEPPAPPLGPPPEPPPPGRRRTGTGERLTPWARDCFYGAWTQADQAALDQATAADEAAESADRDAGAVPDADTDTDTTTRAVAAPAEAVGAAPGAPGAPKVTTAA
ncbi:MAG: DUF222 domain-containing protein [Acidimicrobiales bacterium]